MLSPAAMMGKVNVGNDAAWALGFHVERPDGTVDPEPKLLLSREDYYAEVQATLPGGLEAGSYRFVIEGITDEHYASIAQSGPGQPSVIRLYLYWRDTNGTVVGYFANLGGLTDLMGRASAAALKDVLVAELSVLKVTRQVGSRRYEAVITARERVFHKLKGQYVLGTLAAESFEAAVKALCSPAIEYTPHQLDTLPKTAKENPGTEELTFDAGKTFLQCMEQIGAQIEDIRHSYGRGVLLIRRGTLHVGTRPIPLDDKYSAGPNDGLIQAAPGGTEAAKPADKDSPAETDASDSGRRTFTLIFKGRPDILPGHVIGFHPALEDGPTGPRGVLSAVAGSFLGPLVDGIETGEEQELYVSSVEHKLGRTTGFVTTVVGVVLEPGRNPWDESKGAGSNAPPSPGATGGSAGAASNAVRALKQTAQDAAGKNRQPEVGEVRSTNSSGQAPAEPPGQTSTLWRGLGRGDGRSNQARRLEVRRFDPVILNGVAYATPFAFGKAGLVLPRYPGTRVLMVHRNGETNDPVDVGALWESGKGPDARPGDWWLILPSEVPEAERSTFTDDKSPAPYSGAATNDLIDADGNRVIEVGELTVRVGRLGPAGQRPPRAATAESITIEHKDGGARITIDKDGKIVIHARKDLELVSEEGNIKLSATNGSVDVAVLGEMNVH